jgi:hypothetical protein
VAGRFYEARELVHRHRAGVDLERGDIELPNRAFVRIEVVRAHPETSRRNLDHVATHLGPSLLVGVTRYG